MHRLTRAATVERRAAGVVAPLVARYEEDRTMATKQGRAWKLERASVSRGGETRSNKYSGSDSKPEPAPGERQRAWVGGYTRKDGTRVEGHYRRTPTGA